MTRSCLLRVALVWFGLLARVGRLVFARCIERGCCVVFECRRGVPLLAFPFVFPWVACKAY